MRIGKIKSIVGNEIVVESKELKELPKVGSIAFVQEKRIGRIFDIIGRVTMPYVIIKAFRNINSEELINELVYIKN